MTTGVFVTVNGEPFYKLEQSENLANFFISVASASDIWMFMSSRGAMTAGRQNALGAVFPYETDDKLHASTETGSKTLLKIRGKLWEPFRSDCIKPWNSSQNIYKSLYGNKVVFEEINHDLGLCCRTHFESSELYGIVKTMEIENRSNQPMELEVLDGFQNILPYGVNSTLQANTSTLVDAYKANERCDNSVLALYSLTTLINDTPNPMEVLKANVAWTTNTQAQISLSAKAIEAFCREEIQPDVYAQNSYGCRGAYFVHDNYTLKPGETQSHSIVLDSGYSHSDIVRLEKRLQSESFDFLYEDIKAGTVQLSSLVAKADGMQKGGDSLACAHHYLNTLYNSMRGGVFEKEYEIEFSDFLDFVRIRNTQVYEKIKSDPINREEMKTIHQLKAWAAKDPSFLRLALEYMPLSFSRRHGDPSRPWNQFNIRLKDENGKKINSYEGNWRDIFQNWEALGLSFPGYYENMVAKFLNASTIDGFNPYRINREGVDWERIEPENPFGGFGYWGDHQIIYLLRLLKGLYNHFPEQLYGLLGAEQFSYANVPYRLKSYEEILQDSKQTIDFDFARDKEIESLCAKFGTDARLVLKDREVYLVSMMEKLLVPLLSKISNLLPGGGIWMNTQRPEWNDANNAIVGIGLSMVTVYHLYAYIHFLQTLLSTVQASYQVSAEVAEWMGAVAAVLKEQLPKLAGQEKSVLDRLGKVFSDYRQKVYTLGFSAKTELGIGEILDFLAASKNLVEDTIAKNKSEVYATYNLLNKDFSVSPMRIMLEGQSAVIGSGILEAEALCALLDEMKPSLYSPELSAHYLYPLKATTRFKDKNRIQLDVKPDGRLILKDENQDLHFAPSITCRAALLSGLAKSEYSASEQEKIIAAFEDTFHHNEFTGRSEVMYKFEGIGCVYWHQNAKLALAVLESALSAHRKGQDAGKLYSAYKQLTQGFIYRKSPKECGAIPIEPYSHTSFNRSSEQPGMTGQVKEALLMRRGELGVIVENGQLRFEPYFISPEEFDQEGTMNFSICGTPVTYKKDPQTRSEVVLSDGERLALTELLIPSDLSRSIFLREGKVISIHINLSNL